MAVSNLKYQEFNDLVYRGMRKNENIDVHKANLPSYYGLAGMSDQRNYWQFDIPAMMVNDTSFLRNPNYHLSTDTIDTLNFEKMSEVVNCVIESVKNISAELNDLDKTPAPPNRQKPIDFQHKLSAWFSKSKMKNKHL
jgi:aminopeptidase-like protein